MDTSHKGCSESEPFALQVLGTDMEPEFPNGCIIVGEPSAVLVDGCYVIAKYNDSFIFRQLRINAETDEWTLNALKDDLPVLSISGPDDIRARVVQSTNGRRHTRKHYT